MLRKGVRIVQLTHGAVRRCLSSSAGEMSATPVVDMHTHFLPKQWMDFSTKYGTADGPWPWMRHDGSKSTAMLMQGDEEFRPVTSRTWSIAERVQDMDAMGLDYQLLSATPVLFQYHRAPETTVAVAQYFNDLALEMCEESKGRIFALAQVPLQHIDLSCEEASRAAKAGHKGVQIGNHVGMKDLDDKGLVTFLKHCANEGIPVLAHPWDMLGKDRMSKYMMGWTVGMPAETQLSIVAMILSGAFDELPRSLKLCFAHGGGSFAFLLGRLQNAWIHRDIARGNSQHPPAHYVDRFSVDSAVFDEKALHLLVETMGAERVMLGSDYPFPLGEQVIGSLVRDTTRLDNATKERVLGTNAINFFNLPNKKII